MMMNKAGTLSRDEMDADALSQTQSSCSRSYSYSSFDPSDLSPETGTPPWKRWSNSLRDLLDDPVGNQLFRDFLSDENADAVHLFYFACEGLKRETNQEKRARLLQIIYKKLVQPQSALVLMPETRARLDEIFVKEGEFERNGKEGRGIFDDAQKEAWRVMERDLYPNFIGSEKYRSYVNAQFQVEEEVQPENRERSATGASLPVDNIPVAQPTPSLNRIVCPQAAASIAERPAKIKPPVPVRATPTPPSAAVAPPIPPPPLLSGQNGRESMRRKALEKEKALPTAPPKNGAMSTSGLTKEMLANSQLSRMAENEKQVWQEEENAVNKPYYTKYAPYVLPSGLESEVSARQSQVSRSRPANHRRNGDDVLNFEQAQRMAQVNRDPKMYLLLPTTTHERRLGGTSRDMEQSKKRPDPKEFARLLTIKLEKVLQDQQQEKQPANFSAPSHQRNMASLISGMSGFKIPVIAAQADDSDHVLEEHFERVGKNATPDSQGSSLCHSPQPLLRIQQQQQQQPVQTMTRKPVVPPTATVAAMQRHLPPQIPDCPPPAYTKSVRPQIQPPAQVPHQRVEETDSGYSATTGLSHAHQQEFVSHPYQNLQLKAPSYPYPFPAQPLLPKKHSSPVPVFPPTSRPTNRNPLPLDKPHRLAPLDLQTSSRQGGVSGMSGSQGESRTRSRSQGPRRGGRVKEDDKEIQAMFRVGQQGDFFSTKMHGSPTLANFKSVLPVSVLTGSKPGKISYYFKKPMEGVGCVWDEVKDDNQLLPIMDGRVTATIETSH